MNAQTRTAARTIKPRITSIVPRAVPALALALVLSASAIAAPKNHHDGAGVAGRQSAALAMKAMSPNATAVLRRGDTAFREGKFLVAAKHYSQATVDAPSAVLPHLSAGIALTAARQPRYAITHYRQAVRLADDDLIAAMLLQGALAEVGDAAESQQIYLDTVRRFKRDNRSGLDASGSIIRLSAAADAFPESAPTQLLLGDAYQMDAQWEAASRAYRRAIVLSPAWTRPRVNLGLALLAQNRPEDAIASLSAAVKQDPGNVQAQLAIGEAQVKSGRAREALTTYRKLERVPAVAVLASTGAAQACVQLGQIKDAEKFLGNAQKLAPRDPGPVAALAEIQLNNGEYARAAESYESALRLAQEGGLFSVRPSLLRALAEAQLSAKRPDDALLTLGRAVIEDPANAPLWHRLTARAHSERGEFIEAEAALRHALDTESSMYPQDTLNAIAARGLIQKLIVDYRADLDGAKTGVRGSHNPQTGVTIQSIAPSVEGQIIALSALGHLYRYQEMAHDEVSVRRDLCTLRGNGGDWFLLAQAQERLGERVDARVSYSQALTHTELSAPARRLAEQRLKALAAP